MSTKNYLCIMRSPKQQNTKSEPPSPEQMQAMFNKFNAWKEQFQDKILDMGGKLGEGKVVTSQSVTDGPFIESKEVAGGYMIVAAASLDEAVEVAQQSPGVFPGSSVEVREISTP